MTTQYFSNQSVLLRLSIWKYNSVDVCLVIEPFCNPKTRNKTLQQFAVKCCFTERFHISRSPPTFKFSNREMAPLSINEKTHRRV